MFSAWRESTMLKLAQVKIVFSVVIDDGDDDDDDDYDYHDMTTTTKVTVVWCSNFVESNFVYFSDI